MSDSHWQIEQGCPQCGAPVTLDETDRLLACPFCRTRLYLVPEDHFHYHIPPAAGADGELFYIPYWRLRGSLFSVTASEVTHRFVDTNTLAVNFPGLPSFARSPAAGPEASLRFPGHGGTVHRPGSACRRRRFPVWEKPRRVSSTRNSSARR